MPKLSLSETQGGYNLTAINDNFNRIEDEFNNKVLYRNNPIGEPNSLFTDIDANGRHIYNLPAPSLGSEPARLIDLQNIVAGGDIAVGWEDITGKPLTFPPSSHTHPISEVVGLTAALDGKQAVLESGVSLKTVNGNVLLGSGDVAITAGETNTASNLGAGTGLYASKSGVDLRFRSLVAGTNVTLSNDANTVTINASGGGGGSGDVVGPAGGVVDGEFALYNSTTGKLIKNAGGQTLSALTTTISGKQASLVSGTNIKTVNSTTLLGSGNLAVGDVVGPASAVTNSVVTFNGTTGKLVQDSGKTLPSGTIVGTSDAQTLTGKTFDISANTVTVDGTNLVGYRNIPQVSQSAAYTAVLSDAGKHIFHPSADTTARIFTIPANSSVAYPVGTALTFVNQNGAGVVTIAITTDTMRLAGAGTTGSRTLAANGMATALKITSTEWIISGTGLT